MKKLIIFALLLASSFLRAQSLTTVTATITDPSGQAFVAGTVQADYQRPAGKAGVVPLSNGLPIVEHGAALFTTLNSSGHFSINLADLSTVSPTGGVWLFTICPNATAQCPVANTAAVFGATIDLSAILSTQMPLISVAAQPTLARAYKDSEIISASGITWLDVTLNKLKYIDALGVIHTLGGGNGTITSITATSPIVVTPSPITLTGDISCPTCLTTSSGTLTGSGTTGHFSKWTGATSLGDVVTTDTLTIAAFISASSNVATVGVLRLGSTDVISWRNNAHGADVSLSKNTTDDLVFPNGFSLGGGTTLATTNQSGTGNLCLVTNCQLITPAVNGVVISGTPSATDTLNATSPTAASWGPVQVSSTSLPSGTFTPQVVTSTGDVTMTTGLTVYHLLSESVTMPATGGTYRVIIDYSQWFVTGGNVCSAEVVDTTNNHAWAFSQHNDNGLGWSVLTSSAISTQTYAQGTSATFKLDAVCDGNGITAKQFSAQSGTLSPNIASYLSITPVLSN